MSEGLKPVDKQLLKALLIPLDKAVFTITAQDALILARGLECIGRITAENSKLEEHIKKNEKNIKRNNKKKAKGE